MLTTILTFLSTFAGAGAAFLLQAWRIKRREVREQVAACNRAVYTLQQQYDQLESIWYQTIEPYLDNPNRFLFLPAALPILATVPDIEVVNLSFLLETDYADILRELAIEQDRFRSALRTLNERSRLHREQLQVRMERAGISDGDTISSQDLLTKLGKNHVLMMISLTDSVIQAFDTTLESHIDVAKRFTDAMNECFPKKLKSGRKQVLGIGTGQRLRLASSDPSFPDQ